MRWMITEVARIAGVLLLRRVEGNDLSIQQISVIFSSCFFLIIRMYNKRVDAEFRYLQELLR